MKRLLFVLFFLPGVVAGPLTAAGQRQRLLIDKGWKFSLSDTIGAEQPVFNDNKWRTLDLPHDWSIESGFLQDAATGGGGGSVATGVGWYRKHFILPAPAMRKEVTIEFDGVYQNSDVWVNGHFFGHYPSGYVSFYYDISLYVKRG